MFPRHALASIPVSLLLCLPFLGMQAEHEAQTPTDAPTDAEQLAELDWLAGSWSGDMWGGRFHAYYSTPVGGKILSYSRLVQGETVQFYEFEVFEVEKEAVLLRPFPGGERADDLTLVKVEKRKGVFENPNKDYPTRITYQRVSDDALEIVLSDPHGESKKTERFQLRRVESER